MARAAGARLIAAVRVAVATGNGIAVDEHFGQATRFKTWELAAGAPRLVEVRRNTPACGAGWQLGMVDPMEASARLVADCRAVLVSQIGDCGVVGLEEQNILPFETGDTVADGLRQLAARPDLFAPA